MRPFLRFVAQYGPETMYSRGPVPLAPKLSHGPERYEGYPPMTYNCVATNPRDVYRVRELTWSDRLYSQYLDRFPGTILGYPVRFLRPDGTEFQYWAIQAAVVMDADPSRYVAPNKAEQRSDPVGELVIRESDLISPLFAVRALWSKVSPGKTTVRFDFCTDEFRLWFKKNRFSGITTWSPGSSLPSYDEHQLRYLIE